MTCLYLNSMIPGGRTHHENTATENYATNVVAMALCFGYLEFGQHVHLVDYEYGT